MKKVLSLIAKSLLLATVLTWSPRAAAQESVDFTNKTGCAFGVTIGYCMEECRESCVEEYVRATIIAGNVTTVPLPRGAVARFMKLQNASHTSSYAAWTCDSGWDVNELHPQNPNCCPNSIGGPRGVLLDGDGYTNTIGCL